MYINVALRRGDGQFSDKIYAYRCEDDDVRPGMTVIAPTHRGETEALVVDVNVDYESLDPRFRDDLRTVRAKEATE